jgi:hypothetical protein
VALHGHPSLFPPNGAQFLFLQNCLVRYYLPQVSDWQYRDERGEDPKKRLRGILGFGAPFGVCSILIGLHPSAILISIGAFGMYFFLPIVNGCIEALWLNENPPDVIAEVAPTTT